MIKRPVVIVEDRPLARDELKYLLNTHHPDMAVIGEFEDIQSAWALIESGQVEGVFLDISFDLTGGGEKDGLILAHRISLLKPTPWIIFLTAREEYALVAHDFRPFGYLLKPFDDSSLDKVLNRVRVAFSKFTPSPVESTPVRIEISYKKRQITEDGHIQRLTLIRFLSPEEILYVASNVEKSQIEVHLVSGEVLENVNLILNKWLELNLPCFRQIRKNAVANLNYVSGYRADPIREGNYLLQFKRSPVELPIGAIYFAAFREAIKKCI
jgi:two-component system, LytTR family, response regulator LytT